MIAGSRLWLLVALVVCLPAAFFGQAPADKPGIGQERAIARHLKDDEEFRIPLCDLVDFGKRLFEANWTEQDGGGRPLMKGTGKALSDPTAPLTGNRAFNRISGPDANSCYGCHAQPFGITGGSGDFATNVFVLAQRFDFVTLNKTDKIPTKGASDELQRPVALDSIGNLRKTPGLFGAGYLEMLAREMTEELQGIRDSMKLGDRKQLMSKGVSFGWLTREKDGTWNTSGVQGLPRLSILSATPLDRPSLIIRPWHQAGNVISIREFTNNAFNQHHGMQSTERFGIDTDPDGDGIMNELTRADITAISVFQAVMAAPGRVIPNDPAVEKAILDGEKVFAKVGCAACHVPSLRLSRRNWTYTEPNPYNPAMNLRGGDAKMLAVNLVDMSLPSPRLLPASENAEFIDIPAFTDFKLHDITDPNDSSAAEPLDMNQPVWSPKFTQGNRRFLTKRLWGCANEPPFFHDGTLTTLRQAVLAHAGEAADSRLAFLRVDKYDQDAMVEFLKSLQVLPPGTKSLVVDEHLKPKAWPPR